MPGRIVNIVVCEGCATERIAPDFLFNRTDDLEFSVKFDEDKEDGDDELTVEEDEDEDELEVEDEEDEEDEASEGFGHELEVEEEEEEDEVLISHLSIAKSQIRPKVSIRLPKQVNFNTNDPETSGKGFTIYAFHFRMFFFLFLLHVSQAGIPRVTQNLPCLVVFVCMRFFACLTVNDYHWQRTSTLNVNCIRPVLNIPKTRCDWSSTLHFLILDMCAV